MLKIGDFELKKLLNLEILRLLSKDLHQHQLVPFVVVLEATATNQLDVVNMADENWEELADFLATLEVDYGLFALKLGSVEESVLTMV